MNNEELTFKHLLSAASSLNRFDRNLIVLKSHLLEQCSRMSTYAFKLPNHIFGPHIRCAHCFTSWENNEFSTKAHMKKLKLTLSARKRHKQTVRNKDGKKTAAAIEKAEKYLNSDVYVMQCSICSMVTEFLCDKRSIDCQNKSILFSKNNTPTKPTTKTPNEKIVKNNNNVNSFYQSCNSSGPTEKKPTPIVHNIKRKKLKDKFAGLCKAACMQTKNTPSKPKIPLNYFLIEM